MVMTLALWHGERYGISQKQTRINCPISRACGDARCVALPAGQCGHILVGMLAL
jgi:hypothetical protein